MKATELRFGNSIYNYRENKVQIVNLFILDSIIKGNEDLQPIPLTEEWVLKFGFEYSYRSEFRIKFDFISNPKFGYDFNKTSLENGMHGFRCFGHYYKCEFVHQLQNLYFALTGEELEINNIIKDREVKVYDNHVQGYKFNPKCK